MNVSVFGLGYVGCVTAACLARDGHEVIGVDVSPQKVAQVRAGGAPVLEPGLEGFIADATASGKLRATLDAQLAVHESEISLLCVGTPSNGNGSLKLDYLVSVSREIGAALATKRGYHVVVVRSTVLPGTVRETLLPFLEGCSGKKAGAAFGVCMNPEFLREGSAVDDYDHPSLVVVGELDPRSGDVTEALYRGFDAPVVRVPLETAEMLKYVNNTFHALKVVFANEIGTLCKAHSIDGQEVMELVCRDRRLNISPSYLRPGFAFGGSCLPKDTRALLYRAKERDVAAPLLSALLRSNQEHLQRGIALVEGAGCKRVGVLGLSFKPGTDDIRESPTVALVETLIGRGYEVSVYDEQVDPERLVGANKAFLEREIPHIASLMRPSIGEVIAQTEVVVIANAGAAFGRVPELLRHDQLLIDLVGVAKGGAGQKGGYEGLCW